MINAWLQNGGPSPKKVRDVIRAKFVKAINQKVEALAQAWLINASPVDDDDLLQAQIKESLRVSAPKSWPISNDEHEEELDERSPDVEEDTPMEDIETTVPNPPTVAAHYDPPIPTRDRASQGEEECLERRKFIPILPRPSPVIDLVSGQDSLAVSQASYRDIQMRTHTDSSATSSRATSRSLKSHLRNHRRGSEASGPSRTESRQSPAPQVRDTVTRERASRRATRPATYNVRATFAAITRSEIDSQPHQDDDGQSSAADDIDDDVPMVDYAGSQQEAALDVEPAYSRFDNFASLLRYRELGYGYFGHGHTSTHGVNLRIQDKSAEQMQPWRSWHRMSKNVLNVVWAPSGIAFAASASNDMDSLNLTFNRPISLVYGDLIPNTLREVQGHTIPMPRPEAPAGDDNVLPSTYATLDDTLHTTVSAISFSHDGKRLYSAGYDHTCKIWDVSNSAAMPRLVRSLKHDAEVVGIDLSQHQLGILATAQLTSEKTVQLFSRDVDDDDDDDDQISRLSKECLSSDRASKRNLKPTCLRFGTSSISANYLAAGFSERRDETAAEDRDGDLCLWDIPSSRRLHISPASQSVFDIAWHPSRAAFAAATTPGAQKGRQGRSVVRIFSLGDRVSKFAEYDCPALDINDVIFHPLDDNYIIAACTDGCTYVWDHRRPTKCVHRLAHGMHLEPLESVSRPEEGDTGSRREKDDSGVRFAAFNPDGARLHTGSSDGVIKTWDIRRSPEDAFLGNLAKFNSGVMDASFSPDFSNLLVGTIEGAVHVLSNSPLRSSADEDDDVSFDHATERIKFIPSPPKPQAEDAEESGVACANELLTSGRLQMHQVYGAGKGPKYDGPWATDSRAPDTDPKTASLSPDILATQLDSQLRAYGEELGGQQRVEAGEETSWQNAEKVAQERNYLPWLERMRAKQGADRRVREQKAGLKPDEPAPPVVISAVRERARMFSEDEEERLAKRRRIERERAGTASMMVTSVYRGQGLDATNSIMID